MRDHASLTLLKRFFVGKPIPSHLAHHERLSRVTGLAVLSSDALSSVAYATEEVLRTLVLAGAAALSFASPISFVIATILAIVVFSYRQTIHAYPRGGGAYLVSKDHLGEVPALIAGASLLIDYVLTVAVSIAAGVAALTSAFPQSHVNRVEPALGLGLLLMIGNLRGLRESGRIFAVPTYFFIASVLMLIGAGAWRAMTGGVQPLEGGVPGAAAQPFTLFLLLTAFSNGCTAMTGVEAVSDGVPAFKPPEARNAAATLLAMAALSITMFVGITLLAQAYHLIPLHVLFLRSTRRHYDRAAQLSLRDWTPRAARHNVVVVPVSGVQRAVVQALDYARSLSHDVRGLYVNVDDAVVEQMRAQWERWCGGIPLVVLDSPYRSLMEPLLEYIEQLDAETPDAYVTVVLPEFVPARWWHHVFHNQRALLIKGALLFRPDIVVTSVPFHLQH